MHAVVAVLLLPLLASFRGHAEGDIHVGRSAAGQLKVQVEIDQPLGLPVSVFPGSPGYATGEVGFHSAAVDEPTNDFFQLSSASSARFVLLAKDPGMEVWNDHGSAYMQVGQSFFLGPPVFDSHPLWNLVSGTPGQTYSLTLKIHDVNGVYADSDQFVLTFTSVPPVINIAPGAPGFIIISWTPAVQGLVLQTSPTLFPPAWTNAPSGETNPVTLPISGSSLYFRVRE